MNFYYLRKIAAKRTLQSEAEKIRSKENPTDEEITMLDQLDTLIETSDPMDLIHAKQEVELINMAKQQQEITDRDKFIEQYGEEAYMKYKAQEAIEEQMVLKTSRTPNYQQMKIKINDIQRLYPNVNIELAQNYENLSADEKSYIAEKSYGENIKGYYNPKTDKVVIFADNIKNQAELEKTFAHETAGHKGLEVLLGNDYNTVLDEIYQETQKTHAAELQKIAQTYGKNLDNSADQKYVLEEFLANQADLEKASFFKSLVQKIKMALRKCGFNAKWTDNEIKTLLRRSLAKQQRERKTVMSGKSVNSGNMRFMVAENKPYYQIPWKESLHNVVSDKSVRQPVFVSETPDIFRKIGFTSLPMMMNPRHLRLNYYNRTDFEQKFGKMRQGEHAHALGDELEKLPAALKNPLAIVINQTPNAKPGSIVAITDMNINGKKVVVPILIEAVTSTDNRDIDSHLILTVYDSGNWIETFLTPAIEAEKKGIGILYFDEEKASKYTALSKKKGNIPTGFVHNIAQLGLNVKSQTETFQFKNWFKDSKVVDENGEPLVVYHGSSADFTEFSHKFSMRNGAAEGRGFYFTSDKSKAEGYKTKDGKLFEVINKGEIVPINDERINIIDNKAKIAISLNWKQEKRNWVVSAMGNDLTLTANSLLARNPSEAAKQGIAPKGITTIGEIWEKSSENQEKLRFSLNDGEKSENFKKWFGDSKVVDENGEPLIVYHGSGTTFWEFKTEFTGLGNDQYGSGFYFTTNKETADIYTEKQLNGKTKIGGQDSPNVVQAYLSIQKPIVIDLNSDDMRPENLSRIEVTQKQAYEIIKRAPDIMDEENSPLGDFFEEYWENGPSDSMIRKAARRTDWDLLTLENDWFSGDNGATAFRNAVHEVLGYDGVEVIFKNGEKHFVAWFPNQIKSATDNIGTYDLENNDIRFSFVDGYGDYPIDQKRLKDFKEAIYRKVNTMYTDISDIETFLLANGIHYDQEKDYRTLNAAIQLARKEKAERNAKIRTLREHTVMAKKDPFYKILSQKYGKDFKINAGTKYDGVEFTGNFMDKHKTEKGRQKATKILKILNLASSMRNWRMQPGRVLLSIARQWRMLRKIFTSFSA